MYDPVSVLQSLDQHQWQVIALCGAAMVFNYVWFVLAAVKGFHEKVYPIPVFSTLFWLCGDGTGVLSYDLYFNVYNHWYLKLFWLALLVTVSFEVLFIWMTFKYGRKELSLSSVPAVFPVTLVIGALVFIVSWVYLHPILDDDLNITYFNLANMAGPIAYAGLLTRRRSAVGTSSTIWAFYTLMLISWYSAQASYFGAEFRTPGMLAFFAVNIGCSALLAAYLRAMEKQNSASTGNVDPTTATLSELQWQAASHPQPSRAKAASPH
jgi:hypothetical protein